MANTVNILSYNNTFGDLVAQQNLTASELNTLGANNYTKNTGTLYLAGLGTGLSVTNTAILGTAVVANTTTAVGDITASANVYVYGAPYGLQVVENAIVAKTLVTNQVIANTIVRTNNSLANNITANNIVRSFVINATGPSYTDSLQANTVIFAPFINGSTSGIFQAITSNTTIGAQNITISDTIATLNLAASDTILTSNLVATSNITTQDLYLTRDFRTPTLISNTSITVLSALSLADSPQVNTSNTQIATTGWVKDVLNSGNTFTMYASLTNTNTLSMDQPVNTANNVQFNGLYVGTGSPSFTTNEIKAVGNITAYVSDDRLKNKLGTIDGALDKLLTLTGFYYELNDTAKGLGLESTHREVGVSAQEVQKIQPEAVAPAPVDDKYLTVRYERLIPLIIEAIKELKAEVEQIKKS
jgi:hypothetical protein